MGKSRRRRRGNKTVEERPIERSTTVDGRLGNEDQVLHSCHTDQTTDKISHQVKNCLAPSSNDMLSCKRDSMCSTMDNSSKHFNMLMNFVQTPFRQKHDRWFVRKWIHNIVKTYHRFKEMESPKRPGLFLDDISLCQRLQSRHKIEELGLRCKKRFSTCMKAKEAISGKIVDVSKQGINSTFYERYKLVCNSCNKDAEKNVMHEEMDEQEVTECMRASSENTGACNESEIVEDERVLDISKDQILQLSPYWKFLKSRNTEGLKTICDEQKCRHGKNEMLETESVQLEHKKGQESLLLRKASNCNPVNAFAGKTDFLVKEHVFSNRRTPNKAPRNVKTQCSFDLLEKQRDLKDGIQKQSSFQPQMHLSVDNEAVHSFLDTDKQDRYTASVSLKSKYQEESEPWSTSIARFQPLNDDKDQSSVSSFDTSQSDESLTKLNNDGFDFSSGGISGIHSEEIESDGSITNFGAVPIDAEDFRRCSAFRARNNHGRHISMKRELTGAEMIEIVETITSEIDKSLSKKKNTDQDTHNSSFLSDDSGLCFGDESIFSSTPIEKEKIERPKRKLFEGVTIEEGTPKTPRFSDKKINARRGDGGWELSLRPKPAKRELFQITPPKQIAKASKETKQENKKDAVKLETEQNTHQGCKISLCSKEKVDEKLSDIWESTAGQLVWAKLGRDRWWPGMIVLSTMAGLGPPARDMDWVFWFGDHKVSQIPKHKIMAFVFNYKMLSGKKNGKMFSKAVEEALEVCAERCGKSDVSSQSLLDWANEGFPVPQTSYTLNLTTSPFDPVKGEFPDFVLQSLEKIKTLQLERTEPDASTREERDSAMQKVRNKEKEIKDICIACDDNNAEVVYPHPLFEGGLCKTCKGEVAETIYALGDDGTTVYCVVCGYGGEMFVCDDAECGRGYCVECIETYLSKSDVKGIKNQREWLCFLCTKWSKSTHGYLYPKEDWQKNIVHLFDSGYRVQEPDISYLLGREKHPLRVLSLFDGIGTGMFVLESLGFEIDAYYSSEVDEDAKLVSMFHYGDQMTSIGDIKDLDDRKLKSLCPIDLIIGGSPCNDFSLANPVRKGFEFGGTGVLFFDFYRVLKTVQQLNGDRHVFWLYENVASMKNGIKEDISRFFGCSPALWDSKYFVPQTRARYFWGNIPGMYSTPDLNDKFHSGKFHLDEVLHSHCDRKAAFQRLRTVTTRSNSLTKGKNDNTLPVNMNGKSDRIWNTELEVVFGFPPHYTDVGNMGPTRRQKLLGQTWAVPVIKHILMPLTKYFKTTNNGK